MKSNLGRGSGPLGLLNYIFQIGKGVGAACPTILATNLSSRSPRDMARELRSVFLLRPDVKRPLLHVSLSLVPGEKIDEQTWQLLIDRYLKKIGFPIGHAIHIWPAPRHEVRTSPPRDFENFVVGKGLARPVGGEALNRGLPGT